MIGRKSLTVIASLVEFVGITILPFLPAETRQIYFFGWLLFSILFIIALFVIWRRNTYL